MPRVSAAAVVVPDSILHIVFVVDGSGSMTGERIASLNWAAMTALPVMRDAAEDHPGIDVRIRVARFSALGVDWPIADPTPLSEVRWVPVQAGGESPMGAALHAVAAAFEADAVGAAPVLPPVIVLLSDGLPTDDARAGLAALKATELGRDAIRIPIAIGSDADLDLLSEFGGETVAVLKAADAETLVAHIHWAAKVAVTEGATGGSAMAGPPAVELPKSSLLW